METGLKLALSDTPKTQRGPFKDLKGAYSESLVLLDGSMLYRGSYMKAHVLLILLNKLGKRDKMRGLPSILSLFRNSFNKINKT